MVSPDTSAPRRRLGAIAATVLAVALISLGFAVVELTGSEPATTPATPGTPASTTPAGAADPVLDLDLGPVSDPTSVTSCLTPDFAADPLTVDVLYTLRQRTADGSSPVLLLRNAEGDLRLCDVAGPDAPAQLPLPADTEADPVAFLTNGRMQWDCTGTTVDAYTATTWLAVGPGVDRVQQRFWVDGTAGPWFTTRAQDGYAHLQTWLEGPLDEGTDLAVEHRVLDAAGFPVPQSTLPTDKQPLPGCTDGDVQIG